MLELFTLLVVVGLGIAVCAVGFFFLKILLLILFWPIAALFWLIGGAFKILVLPFQLAGGLLLALLFLPLLLIGLPILFGVGVPLLGIALLILGVWIVGSILCWVGGFLFGWC